MYYSLYFFSRRRCACLSLSVELEIGEFLEGIKRKKLQHSVLVLEIGFTWTLV